MGHPLDSFSDPNTCYRAVVVAVGVLHTFILHVGPHQSEANGPCYTGMPARGAAYLPILWYTLCWLGWDTA